MNGEMLLQHAAGIIENRRDRYGDPTAFEEVYLRFSEIAVAFCQVRFALW